MRDPRTTVRFNTRRGSEQVPGDKTPESRGPSSPTRMEFPTTTGEFASISVGSDSDPVYHASVSESAHGRSRLVFHVVFNRSRVNGKEKWRSHQVGRRGSDLQGRRAVP